MKKKVMETPHPSGWRGGPEPHRRYQRDGTKDEKNPSLSSGILGGCSDHDESICRCSCHSELEGMMIEHCTPCCEISPCGQGIKTGFMQFHISQCERCRTIGEQGLP